MAAKEQRRLDWADRIAKFRASGMTMAAWCAANQCTIDQLKYWLYKAKPVRAGSTSPPSTPFVRLSVADPIEAPHPAPPLVVHIGSARIELRSGFDPQLLREVVHALGEASCSR
jgi:hypothetical protein